MWLAYNLPFMVFLQAPKNGADMRQNTARKMFLLCTERRAWRKISPLCLRDTMANLPFRSKGNIFNSTPLSTSFQTRFQVDDTKSNNIVSSVSPSEFSGFDPQLPEGQLVPGWPRTSDGVLRILFIYRVGACGFN